MPEFKMEDILIDRYGNDLRDYYHLVYSFFLYLKFFTVKFFNFNIKHFKKVLKF